MSKKPVGKPRKSSAQRPLAAVVPHAATEKVKKKTKPKLPFPPTPPAPHNGGDDNAGLSNTEKKVIIAALRQCGIIGHGEPNPSCNAVGSPRTGADGKSRVICCYLFSAPRTGEWAELALTVVAKFDADPQRANAEWDALQALKRVNLPSKFLFPINGRNDGVMIYRAVQGMTPRGKYSDLDKYVAVNMAINPEGCRKAIKIALHELKPLYRLQPGAKRDDYYGDMVTWKKCFGEQLLENDEANPRLREGAQRIWPETQRRDWDGKYIHIPHLDDLATEFGMPNSEGPNPIKRLRALLKNQVNESWLSRIHGDTNLSNFLICESTSGDPEEVFTIDLSDSRPGCPTVVDLARMEAEIWLYLFCSCEKIPEGRRIPLFLELNAFLDFDHAFEFAGNDLLRDFVGIVNAVRDEVRELYPQRDQQTGAVHYHWARYFVFLERFINRRTVSSDAQNAALLGAVLSLHYAEHPRRGGLGRADPPPMAPTRLASRARSVYKTAQGYIPENVVEVLKKPPRPVHNKADCPCRLLHTTYAYSTEYFRSNEVTHDQIILLEKLEEMAESLKSFVGSMEQTYHLVNVYRIFQDVKKHIQVTRRDRDDYQGLTAIERVKHVITGKCGNSLRDSVNGVVDTLESLKSIPHMTASVRFWREQNERKKEGGVSSDGQEPMGNGAAAGELKVTWAFNDDQRNQWHARCTSCNNNLGLIIRAIRKSWKDHFNCFYQQDPQPGVGRITDCLESCDQSDVNHVVKCLSDSLRNLPQHKIAGPLRHWPQAELENAGAP